VQRQASPKLRASSVTATNEASLAIPCVYWWQAAPHCAAKYPGLGMLTLLLFATVELLGLGRPARPPLPPPLRRLPRSPLTSSAPPAATPLPPTAGWKRSGRFGAGARGAPKDDPTWSAPKVVFRGPLLKVRLERGGNRGEPGEGGGGSGGGGRGGWWKRWGGSEGHEP